ncbi:F420-dependent NADP oxidoreductase [Hymenobacter saemangeumensis]|uniref:F420-dependent NADP oxidoreductase n=1 Tax=Hymenobacter saemangeumensis TaxID=1084522 RepID=A0ABP8IIV2_9BACT
MTVKAFLPLRVALLGSGRVASQLGPALVAAGHCVPFVWSRSEASAKAAAAATPGALPLSGPVTGMPAADVYLLAVPDAAVATLLGTFPWPAGALVAHMAGALPLAVFAQQPLVRGGVFYPLQTFSPGRAIHWPSVPLCLEAADEAGLATLQALAGSLSEHLYFLSSEQRLRLHVAAVFANNFTNHLLGIADALLHEAGLPPALLAPLVRETVDKALANPPFAVQTGPAVRRDAPTLQAHESVLAGHPAWQALYAQLTASIQAQL